MRPLYAGVVPWRQNPDAPGTHEVLLITSRSTGRWLVPKGHIERHLSAAESAALEALEEAGVEGVYTTEPFTTWHHRRFPRSDQRILLFTLHVTRVHDTWREDHQRQRIWLPFQDARQRVEDDLARCLQLAAKSIGVVST